MPGKAAPMRGSVARAAVGYNSPDADAEVEEVAFQDDPKEPLHGTQFFREATNSWFYPEWAGRSQATAFLVFSRVRSISGLYLALGLPNSLPSKSSGRITG